MCKSWCEAIIAIIVIIFALWDSWMYSKWIVIIAGIVLLIHSFTCKKCFHGHGQSEMMMKSKGKKR